MSEELEALERTRKKLAKHYDIQNIYEWSNIEDDLDVIETALKRSNGYESHTTFTMVTQINALRDENEELKKRLNEMYELREQYHLDQKKLKAYEIIIEKEVNVQEFKYCLEADLDYEMCEKYCQDNNEWEEYPPYRHSMKKEEFDLLKEVLQ